MKVRFIISLVVLVCCVWYAQATLPDPLTTLVGKGALVKGAAVAAKGALVKGALLKGALIKGALLKGALIKGAIVKGALVKGAALLAGKVAAVKGAALLAGKVAGALSTAVHNGLAAKAAALQSLVPKPVAVPVPYPLLRLKSCDLCAPVQLVEIPAPNGVAAAGSVARLVAGGSLFPQPLVLEEITYADPETIEVFEVK